MTTETKSFLGVVRYKDGVKQKFRIDGVLDYLDAYKLLMEEPEVHSALVKVNPL